MSPRSCYKDGRVKVCRRDSFCCSGVVRQCVDSAPLAPESGEGCGRQGVGQVSKINDFTTIPLRRQCSERCTTWITALRFALLRVRHASARARCNLRRSRTHVLAHDCGRAQAINSVAASSCPALGCFVLLLATNFVRMNDFGHTSMCPSSMGSRRLSRPEGQSCLFVVPCD